MQTYQSERNNYQIDVPEDWSCPGFANELLGLNIFRGHGEEVLNIQIGPLFPEPSLNDTEAHFRLHALRMGYRNVECSLIEVEGKDHFCAKYAIPIPKGGEIVHKKYCIVFNGIEYAITCTLGIRKSQGDNLFVEKERLYDSIASTFKNITPHAH